MRARQSRTEHRSKPASTIRGGQHCQSQAWCLRRPCHFRCGRSDRRRAIRGGRDALPPRRRGQNRQGEVGSPVEGLPDRTSVTDSGRHPGSVTHPRLALASLLVVPVLGSILCVIATRHGIGIGQDSAAYMGAADNLLHGRGHHHAFRSQWQHLVTRAGIRVLRGSPPRALPTALSGLSRCHFFNRTVDCQWGEMAQCNLDGCKPVRVRVARPAVLNVTPLGTDCRRTFATGRTRSFLPPESPVDRRRSVVGAVISLRVPVECPVHRGLPGSRHIGLVRRHRCLRRPGPPDSLRGLQHRCRSGDRDAPLGTVDSSSTLEGRRDARRLRPRTQRCLVIHHLIGVAWWLRSPVRLARSIRSHPLAALHRVWVDTARLDTWPSPARLSLW